ncbi:tetratricopeptide repeat protein [Paenibacillus paeoniae]|nr:tetratricopeptide repeat protein [Paenibacillus paeoniae]
MIERDHSQHYYPRIYQLMEWKRYEEAQKEVMNLLRELPEDPEAHAIAGQICLRLNKRDEALHWSQEAIRLDPDNALGWFVRTCALYEAEKWRALDESLENAQRIDPYEPFYYFLRANICNQKNHFNEARDHLLKGLQISPHNALYLATLSYTEALLNHVNESRALAREALRQEVESDQVYLYLGWAAERRSDYDDQLLMLKNAIQLDPDNKQIREEYLEALQKGYKVYRILLAPTNLLKRMKPWQIFLSWMVAALLFRPLIILFIVLYILTHWSTKLLVHVKVFGWTRRR